MFEHWAWGTYIFFAVFLAGGTIWVWLCLPETKNATLEDMDRVFKSHNGEIDALLLEECRREVGLTEVLETAAIESVDIKTEKTSQADSV